MDNKRNGHKNTSTEQQQRRRGQRGKDKQPRKQRQDKIIATSSDENSRLTLHTLELMKLGTLKDKNSVEEVEQRIEDYFIICSRNGYRPSVASLALAFGIDRVTLFNWINGVGGVKNPEVINTIKKVYAVINAQYEEMMNSGKINPVAGIFLMKNNLGYKDSAEHIITARQEQQETEETLLDRAGLLTD